MQQAYPLGHSLSKNNLGKDISITLNLTAGDIYDLRNGNDSSAITYHLLPSNQTDSAKIHKTEVDYKQHQIIIHPDSITGEFITDLIPESFIAAKVNVTGWNNLLIDPVTLKPYTVTLDFTNKFFEDSSIYTYTDSSLKDQQNQQEGYNYTTYKDTVLFNASYQFIKRVIPAVNIAQVDFNNKEMGFFGDSSFQATSFLGTKESIKTVDLSKNGPNEYLLNNPIFTQTAKYNFKINAFEQYPFHTDETVISDTDNVPTEDGFVTITNNLKKSSLPDTMSLDQQGTANYPFIVGDPASVDEGGLKNFSASIKFGAATYVDWKWYGNPLMQSYVMGGTLSGTDFVTQGPDKLLFVLRDPPGSSSYSFAESGSTISNLTAYSGSYENSGNESINQIVGAEVVTWTGVGGGVINNTVFQTGTEIGISHEEHYAYSNTKATTVTLTTDYKTSDNPSFVGTPADVFVGYSTNITYGSSQNITLINKKDKYADDVILTDSTQGYLVVKRSGINLGESFGTLFAYTNDHIENNLIPALVTLRNSFLNTPLTIADSLTAQAKANSDGKPVYISKLKTNDPNYGKSNNDAAFGADATNIDFDGPGYRIFFPAQSDYRSDTIMTLNQFGDNWKLRLRDDEKAKINARFFQNYSFTAGSPISYLNNINWDTTDEHSFNIVLSAKAAFDTRVDVMGTGFVLKIEETHQLHRAVPSLKSTAHQ